MLRKLMKLQRQSFQDSPAFPQGSICQKWVARGEGSSVGPPIGWIGNPKDTAFLSCCLSQGGLFSVLAAWGHPYFSSDHSKLNVYQATPGWNHVCGVLSVPLHGVNKSTFSQEITQHHTRNIWPLDKWNTGTHCNPEPKAKQKTCVGNWHTGHVRWAVIWTTSNGLYHCGGCITTPKRVEVLSFD